MFKNKEKLHIKRLKKVTEVLLRSMPIPFYGTSVFAGGWFASILRNETPKDIDIFLLDGYSKNISITAKLKERHSNYINNVNIVDVYEETIQGTKIQYIITKYKTREELIEHFDFEHCKVSYQNNTLYISPKTYRAIMNKELIPNETNPPTQRRIDKFLAEGYSIKLKVSPPEPKVVPGVLGVLGTDFRLMA